MKTVFAILVTLVASVSVAHADGLVCTGQQTALTVKVYNHVQPKAGTRVPALMVVSDPFVNYPNKTIAKFTDADGTLAYLGDGHYEAKVDLRYRNISRGGENIAGTKLAQLKSIQLIANFSYATNQLKNGEALPATLNYVKRTGEVLSEKADCVRYLKN